MHQRCEENIHSGSIGRLVCFVLLLTANVDVFSQNTDDSDGMQFHNVFVFLATQEGLLDSESGDPEFFNLDPFGINRSLEGWRTKTGRNDVQRLRDALQSALGPFHFESSSMNILAAAEVESDWGVWDYEVIDSIELTRNLAQPVFLGTPVDYVLGVDTRYFMSPGLDQFRLTVRLKLVPRPSRAKRPHVLFTRQFEYLSPSIGRVLRPFHDGEKEALAAEIEEAYRRLAEEGPDSAEIYEKEKNRELKMLAKREVIPRDVAVLEAWPDRSLARVVGEARRHIGHLISLDLRVLRGPEPEKGERVRFEGLDRSGDSDTKSGYLVDTLDGNTMYRDRKRNMYSVPTLAIATR